MIPTTHLPDAVQWSEGMLLSPQHFQQNDIYWHQHLRHAIQAQSPHYWGVLKLSYSLTNNIISISELECILPDGLAIEFPGNFPRNPIGNLEKEIKSEDCVQGGPPLCVWLRVRERHAYAAVQGHIERRYDSIGNISVADENTGEGQLPVERLQTRFELYFGGTSPSIECAVPLLKLERGENNVLAISRYHPPMLHLEASDFQRANSLAEQLRQLHDLLWSKTKQLAGNSDDALPDQEYSLSQESLRHLVSARNLASCLPQFSVNLHHRCHPSLVYQSIAQIVGQVASFGANPLPLKMEPYNHEDCFPQFQIAIAYITSKLKLVETTYELLRFARIGRTDPDLPYACFARRLLPNMDDNLIIELIPKSGQTKTQMLNWITQAKIASEANMPQLLIGRLQGANVRALSPAEISRYKRPPESSLFLIKNQENDPNKKARSPSFSAEQSLLIQGQINNDLPEAIILYHNKTSGLGSDSGKGTSHSIGAVQYA
ncbi:type VI secretion system baseplate subunit TssK [Undibacterium sp. Xuan67W]|uniref:type VI secretion system baseplate subunit TssK n=1 Tax=Undibacterium sp. Xuan67W TaxID=3413057 RepID=UPI003BF05B85